MSFLRVYGRAMRRYLLAFAFAGFAPAASADLGINFYGLSYHFDRSRARELGLDNEVNPGLGLRYRTQHSERLDWIFDVGGYRDSGRNTALLAGAGGLFRVTQYLRLGGALVLFDSETYNRGNTVLAPLPLAAIDTPGMTFNFFYTPSLSKLNDVATLGFWVTWWIR